jgi:spore coat protein U-like protein
MRKVFIATLSGAALLAAASTANAALATSTFNVTATVLKNCLVSSADLPFGSYTPNTGALTGNSAITVRCTKTTPYTVALNAGSTAGGSLAQRLMGSGANTLQYNLYTSAALTTVFGDGTGGTSMVPGTGNGMAVASAQTVTVYGSLLDSAFNQNAAPGAYTDQITVTVTY